MQCSQCRAENDAGLRLCESCGAEIKGLVVTGLAARGNSEPVTPDPVTSTPLAYIPKHLADQIITSRTQLLRLVLQGNEAIGTPAQAERFVRKLSA